MKPIVDGTHRRWERIVVGLALMAIAPFALLLLPFALLVALPAVIFALPVAYATSHSAPGSSTVPVPLPPRESLRSMRTTQPARPSAMRTTRPSYA